MHYNYKPSGVCSTNIEFDVEDGVVKNVKYTGGCNGNLKMISKLLDGMTAQEIAAKCSGNICGMRGTSCADQLARAMKSVE